MATHDSGCYSDGLNGAQPLIATKRRWVAPKVITSEIGAGTGKAFSTNDHTIPHYSNVYGPS